MDSAIAGVIGALIGGGAAVVGQAISSRYALRQAQEGEKAALRKAEIDKRRTVYENFIVHVAAYRNACMAYSHGSPDDEERWLSLFDEWTPLVTSFTLIELHGPAPVASAATALYEYARELDEGLISFRHGGDRSMFHERYYSPAFESRRQAYSDACRTELDELLKKTP
jgi:hypothetical protein